jgi:uncharacterized protein
VVQPRPRRRDDLILLGNLKKRFSAKVVDPSSDVQQVKEQPTRPWLGYLSMVGIGFYGGFIQAGVGFIFMSALRLALGPGLVRVNMHKVLVVGLYTFLALGIFIWQDKVMWVAAISLAIGNSIGGWIGAHLAVGKGDRFIAVVYDLALVALVIKLVWPWFQG